MGVQGPGAVAANLYQGIRSEYLAQYVFSLFGTVTRVPNEEDHGVDLFCTLTRLAAGLSPTRTTRYRSRALPMPGSSAGLAR